MDQLQSELASPTFIRQHYLSRKIKLYALGAVLLALAAAYIGVERYLEYSDKRDIVTSMTSRLADLTREQKKASDQLAKMKTDNKDQELAMRTQLEEVFPSNERYTDLTRLLDVYFKGHHTQANPIIATDLQFSEATHPSDNSYDILPVSMSITSSEKNFYDFLSFIQRSGTLSKKIRLMDITSIQLNFPDEESGNGNELQYHVDLNAYFQKKPVS